MVESPSPTGKVAAAGLFGGALSGLFGVGGGIVMVPLFVLWLGLDQKRAITTSLLAIIPISILGTIGYALGGDVDWWLALALGAGSVVGGQIGVRLLPRVPVAALQIAFAALLLYSAYRLAFPAELTEGALRPDDDLWLFLIVGAVAGLLGALLGVGGGIILVPAMILISGVDINTARGTSLMVVIITAATATVANIRAERTDLRVGVVAGLIGAPAALGAALVAQWIPARQASLLFAGLMVVAAIQLLLRAWKGRRGSSVVDGDPT